jgi:hypothetical protein
MWVRATGRRVAFNEHPWLRGPAGNPRLIADEWLPREAARLGSELVEGGGLLDDMCSLAAPGFDPTRLARPVIQFYEHTAEWRMEVWSQWCRPFAWLLFTVFAHRLQQLSLPLRPLDTALGLDSRVVVVRGDNGTQVGAGWLRTLRSTGAQVYSGWYGTARLPCSDGPRVRVAFPLPNGSVTVFLRPEVRADGALLLTSPLGSFGDDGAYLIVVRADGHSGWVRRVPLAETFVVWVDEEGTLRTDHSLSLCRVPVLRLHYRLEHRAAT